MAALSMAAAQLGTSTATSPCRNALAQALVWHTDRPCEDQLHAYAGFDNQGADLRGDARLAIATGEAWSREKPPYIVCHATLRILQKHAAHIPDTALGNEYS